MRFPKLILVLMLMTIGCASAPRAFPIPMVWNPPKRGRPISDYPELWPQLFPLW